MAITNAQQYQQLVNKPADGKRPGYRGDAAARSTGAAQMGRAAPTAKSDPGEGTNRQGQSAPSLGVGAGMPSGRDDRVDPKRVKESREEFETAVGKSKLETLKEDGLPDSKAPGVLGLGLNLLKNFRNIGLRRNIDYFQDLQSRGRLEDYPPTVEGYKQYMQDRMSGKITATGNPGSATFDGRDDDQPLVATNLNPFDDTDTDTDTETEDDDFQRFVRLMADGGSVDDMEREAMFLGGITKGIKKAVRGVKKIAKSPIGKLAIGTLLFQGAGGMKGLSSFFGKGSFSPFKGELLDVLGADAGFGPSGLGRLLGDKFVNQVTGNLTGLGKFAALGIPSALAGVMTDKQKKDEFKQPNYPDFNMQAYLDDPYKYTPTRQLSDGGSEDLSKDPNYKGWVKLYEVNPDIAAMNEKHSEYLNFYESSKNEKADGGIMRLGYQEGSKEPVAKKTMPLLDMDGKEMDFREEGGFVPIGRMEKADDVPARLSKNEFVFTADAVRNAGDGDVDKGAEVMYNMMKNLESGGDVSEESQGLEGARKMFQTSKRLEEVL